MANTISFDISVPSASIEPNGFSKVTVSLNDVEKKDLLDLFSADEAVDHFDKSDLLDHIGIDEAKKHFGLVEKEY